MSKLPVLLIKTELSEYILDHLEKPFKWGENDCILFTIGWLSKKAGKNLLEPYGVWKNQREATKAVKKAGGLEKQFNEHLKKFPIKEAKDGSITIVKSPKLKTEVCGIVYGRYIAVVDQNGLLFLDRMESTCAWDYY